MPCWSRPLPSSTFRWLWLATLAGILLFPLPAAAQTGTVSGTVTDQASSLPIANVQVQVLLHNGGSAGSGFTDASGNYSVTVPPGALYYVAARPTTGGYTPKAYPDVPCLNFLGCGSTDLQTAEPFSVTAGGSVTGRNLALSLGGSITGTITDSANGAPVANMFVTLWARVGTTSIGLSTSTNASGVYTLSSLPAGSYYLQTSNSSGYRSEIYPNLPCLNCGSNAVIERGTPVVVTSGDTTSGRDFALERGGSITGVVTNAATGAPLANVGVQAYAREGINVFFAGSATTNAAGEYTIAGLTAASYGLITSSSVSTNELYNNILCPSSCSSTAAVDSGNTVAVTLGAATSAINFALDPGGSISGTVTNEATGLPAQGVTVVAVLQAGSSLFTRLASTNASGAYTILGLTAGTYTLYTSTSQFTNEIFDNVPCPTQFCSSTNAWLLGAPIAVGSGAAVTARNFALQPAASGGGTITGTLTDAVSGLPIGGLTIEAYQASGASFLFGGSVTTSVNGTYTIIGVPAGTYRVASSGLHPFRNEVYANVPCLGAFCSLTAIGAGTPVPVTVGATATANLALTAGDGLTGRVTDAATGAPLAGVTVSVYQVATSTFVGSTSSNRQGTFTLRGLPNGEYVAYTANYAGYFAEIYNDIRCTTVCSAATAFASGTRITVSAAPAALDVPALVTDVNFALDARTQAPGAPSNLRATTNGFTTQFTWDAPTLLTGGAATSYIIEAGSSPGGTFITLPTTGTSRTVPGVPPGRYYVRVRGVNAFGTGAPSNEIVLSVTSSGTSVPETPTGVSAFVSNGVLTMTWSPSVNGSPVTGYVVEAGSSGGLSNVATVAVNTPRFIYSPVPNGVYFLRVRARNAAGLSTPSAEIMVTVGNVAAPPTAPSLNTVTLNGSTVTLAWSAPQRGTATSYLIEAGSAPGLSDVARANTGSAATTVSFANVPRGTYYIRVRAVNAQGTSVASNERILTVQ